MEDTKAGEELIKRGSPHITDTHVAKVVGNSSEIEQKFKSRGTLKRFYEDAQLLIALVRDYASGKYHHVPWNTVAAIVFTLLWVFNPLNLIPEAIPVVGEIDDAVVVGACLFLVERDLLAYKKWKQA